MQCVTNQMCIWKNSFIDETMKYLLLLTCFFLFSCNSVKQETMEVINNWLGKDIIFPSDLIFTIEGEDTVYNVLNEKSPYMILTYVDTVGCTSCRLQLQQWKTFFSEIKSRDYQSVTPCFILYPKDVKDLIYVLKSNTFNYPVCIDLNDKFNKQNHLPKDYAFRTFLLDSEHKIIAIGNPINNPKIKELYLKIIQGQRIGEEKETIQTQVAVPETSFTFGDFSWQEAQTHSFEVKNTGNKPLVIQDVMTSCGCITVDFTKEPVQPGGTAVVKVTYKADRAEYFDKTVTVYGNAEQLPVQLHVSGNAK